MLRQVTRIERGLLDQLVIAEVLYSYHIVLGSLPLVNLNSLKRH
jgi:hypothetical protein